MSLACWYSCRLLPAIQSSFWTFATHIDATGGGERCCGHRDRPISHLSTLPVVPSEGRNLLLSSQHAGLVWLLIQALLRSHPCLEWSPHLNLTNYRLWWPRQHSPMAMDTERNKDSYHAWAVWTCAGWLSSLHTCTRPWSTVWAFNTHSK